MKDKYIENINGFLTLIGLLVFLWASVYIAIQLSKLGWTRIWGPFFAYFLLTLYCLFTYQSAYEDKHHLFMIISWALIGLGFLMGVLISISSKAAVYNSYFYTYRTLGNKVMMISLPIILVILITLIIKYRKYEEVNTPLKVLASLLAVFTFLFMLYSEWMAQAFLLHRFDSAQFANFKLQEVKPPPGQLYTTSSPNPSGKSTGKLIIINADNGKIDPLFLELDGKHMATSPDEVSTVAVVRFDTSHVGSYKSSTGYAGEAYRENCAVQIIDRKTDELLYNYSFSGKGLPSSSKSSATATVDRDAVTKYLNSL